MTPVSIDMQEKKAPRLESANSIHVKGMVTWTNAFWKFSSRSSSDPVLSTTMSAMVFLTSRDIWALILLLASSSDIPSLSIRRWSCVSGSTQTTMMGFVHLYSFASNSKGTSRIMMLHPSSHSFNTSKKMPREIYGASSLQKNIYIILIYFACHCQFLK